MGLDDRDYARDMGRGGWSSPRSDSLFSTAVKTLIVANVIVYVMQLLTAQHDPLSRWFALDPMSVLYGQIWRLTTYDFLHDMGGPWHIFWNMYVLWMAGTHLEEGVLGRREFFGFYLAAGVVSGLCYCLWELASGHPHSAIGASGAVSAVMLFYALRFPDHIWRIFYIIPVPVIAIVFINLIIDLHPVLLQLGGMRGGDGVAHVAHLGGMAFGYFCHRTDFRVTSMLDHFHPLRSLERWKTRRRFRVVRDEEAPAPRAAKDFDAEVDRVLAKVHASGQESLTEAEREILTDASRRYRKS